MLPSIKIFGSVEVYRVRAVWEVVRRLAVRLAV
jgi:hypothetical protein